MNSFLFINYIVEPLYWLRVEDVKHIGNCFARACIDSGAGKLQLFNERAWLLAGATDLLGSGLTARDFHRFGYSGGRNDIIAAKAIAEGIA